MSKQLNVKLNFQADTSQAERALNELSMHLNKIATMTPPAGLKTLSSEMQLAKKSALDLQQHLINAFNVKTGNLDLNKLNASLVSSKQNIGELSTNLLKAGTSGEQAFLNIQRAISNASVQINQANGLLSQFWTTMKNTARWQLSSSILHGFMGALNTAWGYAKDLDKSLNNIRIVTGYSNEEMIKFAESANKAAKALSTTTTKYTDAALIYYQQGLTAEEVSKRTDITIKMANAAGQSAEIVSDQLTAVWNNFYDGTKSLEYYADVMTALGAATASSTDEIAGGLEKFAAIGETIGLSYEYAAAVLATITSNTRQSEEVVGTALKTIFARVQGLKLGETLEDGTSLNKYSEALSKVGISIFEQNGELKRMDDILDEMGAKWDTLSKAQQTALAQTVAGVRQYTQLMSLMNEWDSGDSDSMMANLDTAYNSTGALQEQADIYADSWEAAVDRVKASAEGIYQDLFPTQELTGLMDAFAGLLQGIDGLVSGLGGLKGILLLISSIMLNSFKTEIASGIDGVISRITILGQQGLNLQNIFSMIKNIFSNGIIKDTATISQNLSQITANSGNAANQIKLFEDSLSKSASSSVKNTFELGRSASQAATLNETFKNYSSNLLTVNNVQASIEQASKYLTSEQKQQLSLLQQQTLEANEQLLITENTVKAVKEKTSELLNSGGDNVANLDRFTVETDQNPGGTAFVSDLMNTSTQSAEIQKIINLAEGLSGPWEKASIQVDSFKNHIALLIGDETDLVAINKDVNNSFANLVDASEQIEEASKQWPKGGEEYDKAILGIYRNLQKTGGLAGKLATSFSKVGRKADACASTSEKIVKGINSATGAAKKLGVATGSSEKHMEQIKNATLKERDAMNEASQAGENFNNKMAQTAVFLQKSLAGAMSVGNVASTLASNFSSIAMGISSISNAMDTLADEDASFTTKLTAGAMAATMGMRGLMAAIGGLSTFINSINTAMALNEAATLAMTAATDKDSAAQLVNVLVKKLKLSQEEAEAKVTLITSGAIKVETAETAKNTIANWANVASQAAKFWYISLIIAGIAALVAVTYLLVTAEDAETAALKRSQEALQQSKENYDSAKEAVENFKSSLSDYDEGLKGLEDVKGKSDELKKAVEELNTKALELIETYGLFGKFSYGKFGEIIIDQDALDDVEKQLLENEKRAQNVMYTNQIQVNQAQDRINSNKIAEEKVKDWASYQTAYKYTTKWIAGTPTEVSREYLDNPSEQTAWRGETYRNSQGSEEVQGVAIEEGKLTADELKGLGKAVQDVQEQFGKVEVDQLIKTIQEADNSYGLSEPVIKGLTGIINDETLPSLLELSKEMYGAAEASKYYAQQVMRNEIESKYGEQYKQLATDQDGNVNEQLYANMLNASAKYASTNTKVDGKTLQEHLSEIDVSGATSNSSLKNYKDKEGKNYDISDDRDLGRTYATEIKGWEEEDVSYSAGSGEGTITNIKTGEEITIEDSVMRSALAKQSDVDTTTEQFNEALDASMTSFNDAMASVVQNAASNEIANTVLAATQTEGGAFDYENLVHQLSPEDLVNLNEGGITSEEIFTKLGLNKSDLAAMGVQTGEEFLKGFGDAMAEYDASKFYANMAAQAREQATSSANSEGFGQEESEDIGEYATHLMQVAEESDLLADSLETDAETAAELAVQVGKMNRGVETLADNFGDWKDVLNNSSKESLEYSKAMQGTQKALADVLDVEEQFISDDFVKKHLEDIEKAATGDADAIDDLRKALGESIVLDVVGVEDVNSLTDEVKTALQEMENAIDNADLDVGSKIELNAEGIDSTGFIDACNGIVNAAGMTADEAQAYFNSIGYEPEFVMENKTEKAPMYGKKVFTEDPVIAYADTGDGSKYPYIKEMTTREEQVYMGEHEQNFVVPALSNDGTPKIRSITKKATGSMNNFSSSNKGGGSPGKGGGGGGGSKPKKTSESKKNKSEMVDRYKEINDQLEETGRQMNKNTTLADGLWGEKRLAMLRKNIKLMKQERKELDEKLKLSRKYLKEDKNNLKKQAGQGNSAEAKAQRDALGMTVNFKFDDDGYITNYTSEMTKLYNKREALLKSFGSTMDENEQKRLEEFDKAFDNLKSAYEQYETTMDERDDLEEERMQKKLEQQEAYLNLLNEELELKVSINEADLEMLDYYLSKVENDFYAAAEGMKYLGQQSQLYEDNLIDQEAHYKNLTKAYKDGEINAAQYKEALQEMQGATIENLQSLQESKEAMQDYYGNVLSMAQEELASFTDQMSQLNSVMDHYTSLLDMLGKTKDFETRDKILTSKANNIRNELDVYTEEYRMYSEEAEEWEEKMLGAKIGSNEYETYKKNWDAAREAANEAQENMLAKTEEWAEAMRAIVENNLGGLAADLEASLTGGSNFDTLLNSMDRANSIQEEYLTTTNKIYETNKLMRTAQQEIDKTSNDVAKRKMKDFITETKQLQNQSQLSQYELEIQQAKYDLLLAEIALEEAQNAKSTVRLQRDSEGNFGYVYTADNSQVADAEQKMADAQNRLYNIGLEGANNYNQKYAETMSEMYNELTELQTKYLEGQFANEQEYQDAVTAAKEYYYNKLKQFSSLYQTALTTDSRVVADAWSTDFNDMIYKTDEWKDSIDNYTQQAASELAVWADTVATVMNESGLDNVNSELEKMAADSEALKEVLLGDDGLIAAVEAEVEAVNALSEAYINVQDAIDGVIGKYEKFLGKVNKKFTGSNDMGATTITLPTPQGFDTGGYTGEWGSWGKLAMLHEKEMILNQQDTANLLKTMEFLDNIINTIDLQATNAALGGLLSSPTLGNMNSNETLEQSVKIEASFPNVSSRLEIEEAFDTLINRASQYANRK